MSLLTLAQSRVSYGLGSEKRKFVRKRKLKLKIESSIEFAVDCSSLGPYDRGTEFGAALSELRSPSGALSCGVFYALRLVFLAVHVKRCGGGGGNVWGQAAHWGA